QHISFKKVKTCTTTTTDKYSSMHLFHILEVFMLYRFVFVRGLSSNRVRATASESNLRKK
ncbi:hypothetical protein ACJX0J_032252, partial [Zea mays]